jgi:hypothetical protein
VTVRVCETNKLSFKPCRMMYVILGVSTGSEEKGVLAGVAVGNNDAPGVNNRGRLHDWHGWQAAKRIGKR